jgi:light-regulated signal transduction histidine kinase (bacteriophytochrome)
LDVVDATGAVLIYEKNIIKLGITPNDEQLTKLITRLKENTGNPTFYFNKLSAFHPEAIEYRDIASGMLVSVISRELEEYVIFFKPEQLQFITWAGNPEKPTATESDGVMQISPRKSFEAWSQTVTGTCVSWSTEEISSIHRLKEEITYAINQKAGAIRLLNEKLQDAYDELDTFSYTISHDLKNPITLIKSYAELLARGKDFKESDQNLLYKIAAKADQMNLMINEVLEYSRIGRSEFEYLKIDAGELIRNVINELTSIYDPGNLSVTMGETPDLHGDPTMILQIFSNLIGNAIKYSRQAENPQVHIEGIVTDKDVRYSIKDNGIGILAEDLRHVFELFKRMDNVKDIEGSGVGLAIVKRMVEKHRGRIWVESEVNIGSTFYVSFNKSPD